MLVLDGKPCNGVDLSHWNVDGFDLLHIDWIEYFGHKAVHFGGAHMIQGVDPMFVRRRNDATKLDYRWRTYYMWLVPTTVASVLDQVKLLSDAVGKLLPGESVCLDWEDPAVTLDNVREFSIYMDLVFPDRWMMYANDLNPIMTFWMTENVRLDKVPLVHPNYNKELGLAEALKWKAAVWQVGSTTPPGFKNVVPCDFVLRPKVLDKVCGR